MKFRSSTPIFHGKKFSLAMKTIMEKFSSRVKGLDAVTCQKWQISGTIFAKQEHAGRGAGDRFDGIKII